MATKKQTQLRASKMSSRTLKLRKQFWPKLDESLLWDRKTAKGFTTLPRTMPHICEILDDLGGKGTPLSKVYLSLWCRVFDEAFLEIKSYPDLAYEAGFSGQRAVTLWKQRMSSLVDLGFVLTKEGTGGQYDYILLLNPYPIIKKHYEDDKIPEQKYNILFNRALEVGATDLN
ncbi:hypothetical protein ACTRXD_01370 [Nitrospira sp. T9]|uniref:hypothetical protein n=1 Tax=unclassified Nitrospira TaxID=2652172 RepID=UPI003F99A60C